VDDVVTHSPDQVTIADRAIGPGKPPFLVAEAGVNHNGRLDLALDLVDAAADAGADAVKFQTFQADRLAAPSAPTASYQEEETSTSSQREMLADLELGLDAYHELRERARKRDIRFLSSPFDAESVRFLEDIGVPAIKIPSGEITNLPYLEVVAETGLPAVLSTGMSYLGEVEQALEVLDPIRDQVVILHCLSEYPAPVEEVNLRAMDTLRQAFEVPVGFSDHTMGIDIPVAAVARRAVLVEKHFTLDRSLPGPDHEASLEPEELAELVDAVRRTHAVLGDGIKRPQPSEEDNRTVIRKSLALAKTGSAGDVLDYSELAAVRPATGIAPTEIDKVTGRRLESDKPAGEPLTWEDLE
jgi:N-acetylneuraminate synthase/N,N'-diacetyllegionaminate synthase